MADIITTSDLPQSVRDQYATDQAVLDAMVAGANARALRVAPCLSTADAGLLAEAKLILMGAVQRWSQAGAGALTQRTDTMGPFSHGETYDTRQRAGFNLWPSEITDLQGLCGGTGTGRAFSIDASPSAANAVHQPWCDLAFGAATCSCGAYLAGFPLYEDA